MQQEAEAQIAEFALPNIPRSWCLGIPFSFASLPPLLSILSPSPLDQMCQFTPSPCVLL